MAQAETGAREKIEDYRRELSEAEERLRQGQLELSKFIAASREICSKELSFLEQLSQMPVAAPAPEAEPAPVEEIEEPAGEPAATEDAYPEGDPFARTEDMDATRRINLDDLKFGRNYTGE